MVRVRVGHGDAYDRRCASEHFLDLGMALEFDRQPGRRGPDGRWKRLTVVQINGNTAAARLVRLPVGQPCQSLFRRTGEPGYQ